MTTKAVDHRQSTSRKFTVAELVARERTASVPVRPSYPEDGPRSYVPVAQLLRREGVDFGGDNEPTRELPAVQVPALAANTDVLHVADLLRREGELPEEKRPRNRATAVSSAAVLCGLTIAGLIALKPSIASSPVSDAPQDADRRFSAAPGTQTATTTELKRDGGGAAPTTAANLLRNDTTDAASPAGSRNGTSGGAGTTAESSGSRSANGASDGSVTQPTSTSTAPGDSSPTSQPSEPAPSTDEEPPPAEEEDDETVLDPVLDPVTGAIGGLLDSSSVAVSTSIAALLGG